MIDVHCHLNFKSFKDDYAEVIKNAAAAGVDQIINVGTSLESSAWAVDLASQYENLYAIVGIHPHHADKVQHDWIGKLEKIADHPKVIGIGEIGLDFYSYKSNGVVDPKLQKEVFVSQIQLAQRLRLPLQIHNRHAGDEVIKILEEYKSQLLSVPGMFHCFAATAEVHKKALEMGFFVGFDGNITYPGLAPGESVTLSELAEKTPFDRILIETDSPYLTPIPHRGKRNEPKYAIITAEYIANLKAVPVQELMEQTIKNARVVFPKLS